MADSQRIFFTSLPFSFIHFYSFSFFREVDLDVHKPHEEGGVDKTIHPRMPWHDVHMSVGMLIHSFFFVSFILLSHFSLLRWASMCRRSEKFYSTLELHSLSSKPFRVSLFNNY